MDTIVFGMIMHNSLLKSKSYKDKVRNLVLKESNAWNSKFTYVSSINQQKLSIPDKNTS